MKQALQLRCWSMLQLARLQQSPQAGTAMQQRAERIATQGWCLEALQGMSDAATSIRNIRETLLKAADEVHLEAGAVAVQLLAGSAAIGGALQVVLPVQLDRRREHVAHHYKGHLQVVVVSGFARSAVSGTIKQQPAPNM